MTLITTARRALGLLAVTLLITLPTVAQNARVNIVHNSPYAAAALVDVWVNDARAISDFAFREATGYIDLPANTPLTIDITGAGAANNGSPVFSATVTLEDGGTYLVVASGDPTQSQGDSAFGLFIAEGRESASTSGNAEFIVFHGATDAPSVDVYARGAGVLAGNLSFGQFSSSYLSVPPAAYDIDIRVAGTETVAASYAVDLSGAANAAVAVLASGFLAPTGDAPSFGLLAVFADGTTAMLPTNTARAQVIHNSPYAGAAAVDVFINGARALENFGFRTATPYIDLPAGMSNATAPDITIDITAPGAADNSSPVFSATVRLIAQETYLIVASGDPTQTQGDSAFGLFIAEGREAATTSGNAEFIVFHGVTDAPAVDVYARGAGVLSGNLAFGEFSDGYLSVPPAAYDIDVRVAGTETVAASYAADLSGAANAAVAVLASGFLAPVGNDPAFALIAVFADGTVASLPTNTARVQVIHNSPFAAAAAVDVFINGDRALENFAFRTATPFIDLPAGTSEATAPDLTIDITGPGAADNSSPVFSATVRLIAQETYVVVASGNPLVASGDDAFGLFIASGREAASSQDEVDVLIFHGATDAPAVDVVVPNAVTLSDNLAFGEFEAFQTVGVIDYPIDIVVSGTSTVAAGFLAPLETLELGGTALTVLASGFLAPSGDDPAFGLFVALPSGGALVALPPRESTSAEASDLLPGQFNLTGNYPNPFNPTTNITFDLPQAATVTVNVYDVMGRRVMSIPSATFNAGSAQSINVDASNLASGTYMYRVTAEMGANTRVETGSMVLLK